MKINTPECAFKPPHTCGLSIEIYLNRCSFSTDSFEKHFFTILNNTEDIPTICRISILYRHLWQWSPSFGDTELNSMWSWSLSLHHARRIYFFFYIETILFVQYTFLLPSTSDPCLFLLTLPILQTNKFTAAQCTPTLWSWHGRPKTKHLF